MQIHGTVIHMSTIRLHPTWKMELKDEFSKNYWTTLTKTVRQAYASQTVYPPAPQIFRAYDLCPFNEVKVVIVGQDPYHGAGQANGLSFAVNPSMALPPSLQNIFKEIENDIGIRPQQNGDLSRWAKQGVLLLNSVLTVVAHSPASHKGIGWEEFTTESLAKLSRNRQGIVYLLWGKYAQQKGAVINSKQNLILKSGHPSPFSAHLFHGNHHFSQTNTYLSLQGISPIDWQ